MAQLNRPMTADEARSMLTKWRGSTYGGSMSTFYEQLAHAMENPTPHVVRYSADVGVTYVPPTSFYIAGRKHFSQPSDCVWIVPGTEKKQDAI